MGLLNYSSTIDVHKTLGEVITLLSSHGARSVLIDYDNGVPVGVQFLLPTAYGEQGFRLPVRVDAIWKVLVRQGDARKVPPRFVNREQAQRVGWRIVKDWLEAQLAIVETEMVTMDQVLLPYAVTHSGRTVYETVVEQGGPLLLGPGRETGTGA